MMKVSVIIPVYQDDDELSELLTTLTTLPISEVIIADGETRPPPKHLTLQSPHDIQWLNAPKGRGAQIAAGLDAANHPIVWVLHADSRPMKGSLTEIWRLLSNAKTALVCFPLNFRSSSLSLKFFAQLSRVDSPFTTFGDQGFAFRRTDYQDSEIDLTTFPLLEDIVLRRVLLKKGYARKTTLRLSTSARRFERLGIWRTQIRNLGILLSYWRGVSPVTLYARYYDATPQTIPTSQPS